MLTRGQVAKRLGVSIAAVRAFEGDQLSPRFRHGQWIFDEDEVEELAGLRARGGGRLRVASDSRLIERAEGTYEDETTRRYRQEAEANLERALKAEARLQELETQMAAMSDERKRESAASTERAAAERRTEITSHIESFLCELESMTPRQLRRFLRQNPDIQALLDPQLG